MTKKITSSQMLGEIGEAAVRARFLSIGFQFDHRSRLEAGIDGIVEVMQEGRPLARLLAVQIKTTESARYASEDEASFSYLLKSEDLEYWSGSNLPVIVVLHRRSDETFFWKEVSADVSRDDRKLQFDKKLDALDASSTDRLAALTVPKAGFGYYVPPLGGGEQALVNILPVTLPEEMFVAATPYSPSQAAAILFDGEEPARFDWVIKGGVFWSFVDPRQTACAQIVDVDQVDAIDTAELAFHDDEDERNNFSFLLKKSLDHQVRNDLGWSKDRKLFYFKALKENAPRTFHYESAKKRTSAEVVNVAMNKKEPDRVAFVRHHAFSHRFECMFDQWYIVLNPTYFFTYNGYTPHRFPGALLAGKKRMDNSASLRGQVIMWFRFLTQQERAAEGLFGEKSHSPRLIFGEPPVVELATRVPEDVWGSAKQEVLEGSDRLELLF